MFKYFINVISLIATDAIMSSIAHVNLSTFSDSKTFYKLLTPFYSVSPVCTEIPREQKLKSDTTGVKTTKTSVSLFPSPPSSLTAKNVRLLHNLEKSVMTSDAVPHLSKLNDKQELISIL